MRITAAEYPTTQLVLSYLDQFLNAPDSRWDRLDLDLRLSVSSSPYIMVDSIDGPIEREFLHHLSEVLGEAILLFHGRVGQILEDGKIELMLPERNPVNCKEIAVAIYRAISTLTQTQTKPLITEVVREPAPIPAWEKASKVFSTHVSPILIVLLLLTLVALSARGQPSQACDSCDPANRAIRVNVVAGGAGGGDGAINDGVSSSIKGTVFDYTNSNPLAVRLTDTDGNYVTPSGGSTPVSVVSTNNSTTTPLGSSATFTGTSDDARDYMAITVNIFASHDSATDGVVFEWSPNGTDWDASAAYTYEASLGGRTWQLSPRARYFRLRYTNGGTNQTSFRVQAILRPFAVQEQKRPINSDLRIDAPASLTRAILTGYSTAGGGAFANVKVNPSGAVVIDGSGTVHPVSQSGTWNINNITGTVSLPTGASTAANQSAANSSLSSIDGKITAVDTGAVVVSSSALPTGAATSANQTTANASLSSIDGKLPSALAADRLKVDGSGVTQPVSGSVGISSFPDNEPFNIAQYNGATVGAGNPVHITCVSGCTPGGSFSDNAAFSFGSTAINIAGYVFDDTAPNAVTENNAAAPRMSANRVPYATLRDAAGNERGANVNASNQLSVSVDNTPAVSQSGTWNINNISGTVSLPTGASTAAKQPALGTAGSASADVITVQGIASMTPLLVNGSGVTQPVSGTVTANAGSGTFGTNLAQVNGGTVATGNGVVGAQVQRVAIASDNTAFGVNLTQYTPSSGRLPIELNTNAGVNLAQVAGGTAINGGVTGTVAAGGTTAHGSASGGNPLQIAYQARTTNPTSTTDGQVTRGISDKSGAQVIVLNQVRELVVQNTITLSSTSETTLLALGGSGVFHDLTGLSCTNGSATLVRLDLRDATAGTVRQSYYLAADGGGFVRAWTTPLTQTTANNNWTAQLSAAVTDVRCNVQAVKKL